MDQERFDVIVIGAGQAGPSLAARCGEAGMRVASSSGISLAARA